MVNLVYNNFKGKDMKTLDELVDEMEIIGEDLLKRAASMAAFEDRVLYLVKMEDILYTYTKDKSVLPIPCEEFANDRATLADDVKKLYFIYDEELAGYKKMQDIIKQILTFGKASTKYLSVDFVAAVINNKHEIKNAQKYIKRIMIKCGIMTKEDFVKKEDSASVENEIIN